MRQARKKELHKTVLPELLSLLTGSSGDENVETLRLKMENKFCRSLNDKLNLAIAEDAALEKWKKLQIKVELIEDGNKTIRTFTVDAPNHWPESGQPEGLSTLFGGVQIKFQKFLKIKN